MLYNDLDIQLHCVWHEIMSFPGAAWSQALLDVPGPLTQARRTHGCLHGYLPDLLAPYPSLPESGNGFIDTHACIYKRSPREITQD